MLKITQSSDALPIFVLIFFTIIRSSHQTVYSCNSSVSCGCSTNSATVTRIVGGETASSATWTWAVSISIAGDYLCGGSIISSSWVVTAAHCVNGYSASKIAVYAGSNRRWSGTQIRVASKVIVHPSYSTATYLNDLALLQLTPPLTMTDPYVSSICLPSVDSATLSAGEWPAAGTTVIAVGWGTLTANGSLPLNLQQVTLQTVNYQASTCRRVITDWHVQLCAGVSGGGKDTCQGDSGGPLMMFSSSNQWVLVGVTSNGIGCAEATYSGIYTRVAAYQTWINTNTNGAISTVTASTSTTISTSTIRSTLTTVPTSTIRSTSTTVPTSATLSASTTRSTSIISSASTTQSTTTTLSTSTTQSTLSILSASTTVSTSTMGSDLTSSSQGIQLHMTIVEIMIYNVFVFVLLDFLVASYF